MLKWFMHFIFLFSTIHFMEITSFCRNETYGLYCTNLKTNNQTDLLVINPIGENNTSVKSLFLRNSSGTIGEETFSEVSQIDSLDIQFCSIKNISTEIESKKFPNITDTLMQHFPELRILYISNNHGLDIQNSSFKNAQNLQHLTIRGQKITNLGINYLEGLKELTYLDLNGNGIEQIDENAFNNLKKLNYLILNNNNITQFEKNTFVCLSNLESLELIGNNLKIFDSKIFKNQTELKYIGIPSKLLRSNLQLKHLTDTFKKLESIGLSYNDQNDTNIEEFIELCKISGFEIRMVKNS